MTDSPKKHLEELKGRLTPDSGMHGIIDKKIATLDEAPPQPAPEGRKAELASVAEAFASQFSLERVEGNAHRLNWADGSAISDIYVRQLVSNYLLARYRTLNPDYDAAQKAQP